MFLLVSFGGGSDVPGVGVAAGGGDDDDGGIIGVAHVKII